MESNKQGAESKKPIIGKIKNRILMLSPTVKECLEKECSKDDFFSEGDKPIGKGGFGQVWKVRHKATDKIYVIKVMNKQNIIDQKMVEQINREVDIMYKLNHPHIVKLYNHFEDDDNLYLIMQFASKGQLYSLLKKQSRFDQRTTAQYMREIISGVKYLHSFLPPIIHRDIKPENILLDESGRVKLADFGWSNYDDKNKVRTTYCGTPEYLAPEMIKKEGHDTTVDIWDLGVLMFELLSGHPPFSGSNQNELFMNIKKHKILWPDDFPPLAKNLISRILKQNPKERISLDEIIQHAWFEKNPAMKAILPEIPLDAKQMLESHLLNVKADNVKDEIQNILNKEGNTANNTPNNNANNNITNNKIKEKRQSILDQIKNKGQNSPQTLNIIENNVIPSNNNYSDKFIEELQILNEKLKKDGQDYKNKSDKLENDNKLLKNEILKLKDMNSKSQLEAELQKMKDELDKYKIMNKDRLGLLAEIEEKNNEIIDMKNKMQGLENELDAKSKNLKQLQNKVNESTSLNEANEVKLNDFRQQIQIINQEKDDIANQYQKKLEILQTKMLGSENSTEDNLLNSNRLLEIINESINDFETGFKNKTEKLSYILTEIKEDAEKCDKKFIEIVNDRHTSLLEVFNKIKSSIEDDFNKIKSKFESKETNSKTSELLEWLKKQIAELMPYKIKSSNLEIQVTKLESQLKKQEEMLELHRLNVQTIEKTNAEKNYKLVKNEKYIINLEARLSDVKDYVFRNHPDQLEEFKKWYKF